MQPAVSEGATSGRVLIKPSENRPLTVTPHPPKGERPKRPFGDRGRDLAAYAAAVEAWAPCPGTTLDDAWMRVAVELLNATGPAVYELWLSTLHPHVLDGRVLVIGGEQRQLEYAARRYGRLVAAAARTVWPDVTDVDVIPCQLRQAQCLSPTHPHQEGPNVHKLHAAAGGA